MTIPIAIADNVNFILSSSAISYKTESNCAKYHCICTWFWYSRSYYKLLVFIHRKFKFQT